MDRSIDLYRLLLTHRFGVTARQVQESLRVSRATSYRYLRAFEQRLPQIEKRGLRWVLIR